MLRIGNGYDVHRLVEDRELILGGVKIEHTMGLLGHSDADVLTHAVMDALIGAAALGDIGKLFPDTDEKYRGADSIALLKEVVKLLKSKGFSVLPLSLYLTSKELYYESFFCYALTDEIHQPLGAYEKYQQ